MGNNQRHLISKSHRNNAGIPDSNVLEKTDDPNDVQQYTKDVIHWVVSALVPLNSIKNPTFKKILKFGIPCVETVKQLISDYAYSTEENVCNYFLI